MAADAGSALATLRTAASDGALDAIMERLGIRLLGAFGSATGTGDEQRRDTDWLRELDLRRMAG